MGDLPGDPDLAASLHSATPRPSHRGQPAVLGPDDPQLHARMIHMHQPASVARALGARFGVLIGVATVRPTGSVALRDS
jgi:hypothetical protein